MTNLKVSMDTRTGEHHVINIDNDAAKENWILADINLIDHTQPEELPFVDDEPTNVEATLAERESQYGSFKDVANTTQYLLKMLSTDEMSDVQLEALHMICSKLSRIRHGDVKHVDSWHDIAGYATLVVNDLEQSQ